MMELSNLTIIIPIFVDSYDRFNNAKTVLGYLNHHFKTNVIIHELINYHSQLTFLDEFSNLNITHIVEKKESDTYERTRQLNHMLSMVNTEVVTNYDIDVILPVDSYRKSVDMITNGEYDVVYPYKVGIWQKRVYQSFDRTKFSENYDISSIDEFDTYNSYVGHCFFIKTELYKGCGGENEQFLAYAPEDRERYERFLKFGYNIGRIDDYVYHFEHMRGEYSSDLNPHMLHNNKLYLYLHEMDSDTIKEYYGDVEYRHKYGF